MGIKITLGLSALAIAGISVAVFAKSEPPLQLQLQGQKLLVQGQNSESVDLQLRSADGKSIFSKHLQLSGGQAALELPATTKPVYLSASTNSTTENYLVADQRLQKIAKAEWFHNGKEGIRDRLIASATAKINLAPDQKILLKDLLSLLSHANQENKGKTLRALREDLSSSPMANLDLVQGPSLDSSRIAEIALQKQLDLGVNAGKIAQKASLLHQSLSPEQKGRLNLLSLLVK